MRYLILILFPILLVACRKNEQKVTIASLPEFSCSDSSDDGKFEMWDTVVENLIFDGSSVLRNPDSVVPGYIKLMDHFPSQITIAHPDLSFRSVYDTGKSWSIILQLVDHNSAQVEAFYWVSRSSKAVPDTVVEKCQVLDGSSLSAGCKRIYYYGFRQDSMNYASNQLLKTIPGIVLFKGHFDVEVM